MIYHVFRYGHWQNSDDSLLTVEEIQPIADQLQLELHGQIDFRYSHDEIERACGGEMAMEVWRKVLARRERIRTEK